MGYMKKIHHHIKEGDSITANFFGIEYSGIVIEKDFHDVKSPCIIMEDEETEAVVILPVGAGLALSFVPDKEEKEEEEKEKTYGEMELEELRELCDERKIPYKARTNKRGLINLLTYVDENGLEALLGEETKQKKSK